MSKTRAEIQKAYRERKRLENLPGEERLRLALHESERRILASVAALLAPFVLPSGSPDRYLRFKETVTTLSDAYGIDLALPSGSEECYRRLTETVTDEPKTSEVARGGHATSVTDGFNEALPSVTDPVAPSPSPQNPSLSPCSPPYSSGLRPSDPPSEGAVSGVTGSEVDDPFDDGQDASVKPPVVGSEIPSEKAKPPKGGSKPDTSGATRFDYRKAVLAAVPVEWRADRGFVDAWAAYTRVRTAKGFGTWIEQTVETNVAHWVEQGLEATKAALIHAAKHQHRGVFPERFAPGRGRVSESVADQSARLQREAGLE